MKNHPFTICLCLSTPCNGQWMIPSGKRLHNYGKSPCYSWVNHVNQLFRLGHFLCRKLLVYQRVNLLFPMVFLWVSHGFPMVFPWFSYGLPGRDQRLHNETRSFGAGVPFSTPSGDPALADSYHEGAKSCAKFPGGPFFGVQKRPLWNTDGCENRCAML